MVVPDSKIEVIVLINLSEGREGCMIRIKAQCGCHRGFTTTVCRRAVIIMLVGWSRVQHGYCKVRSSQVHGVGGRN